MDDLFIALNCALEIPHSAACRLAAIHERWLDPENGPLLPPDLGVPSVHVRAALALAARAGDAAGAERERAAQLGAQLFGRRDPRYPHRFRELALAPPALYLRGELPEGPCVAIVGSRRATREGLEVARWFTRELVARGVTIVSGFAVGIDAAAHRATLETDRGRTIAVLGCGLGIDYPTGHRPLGERIAERGAVLTEFPCASDPRPWQFPVRNRLIAALCDACLVVEAAPRSGSLVTARWALELGREVLAVPGRVVDELALGTNRLIADGARPALEPADVLEAIRLAPGEPTSRPNGDGMNEPPAALTGDRRALWLAANEGSASAELLAARAKLPIERALSSLLELELAGQLRRTLGGLYEPFR